MNTFAEKKIVAVIPARKGSKGLKGKNFKQLCDLPLIDYTVKAALDSSLIDEVIISTDDEYELQRLKESYSIQPLCRPESLAQDSTVMQEVICNVIEEAKLTPETCIVLLQPTSPLRTSMHINEALALYKADLTRHVIGVTKGDNRCLKGFIKLDDGFSPLAKPGFAFSNRQLLPEVYFPNGSIYIFSVGAFLQERNFPILNVYPYTMSQQCSTDIDNQADFDKVSLILEQIKNVEF